MSTQNTSLTGHILRVMESHLPAAHLKGVVIAVGKTTVDVAAANGTDAWRHMTVIGAMPRKNDVVDMIYINGVYAVFGR